MPRPSQLPTLAAVAALCLTTEGCCRGWRAAAAATPPSLAVLLGRSPLPPRPLRPLLAWLTGGSAGPRRLAALHFEASQAPGCRSGDMQRLALELLGSAELASAAASLRELAVWDFVCSRPLCALLPRFPALRSLALTGYAIDLDLAPLRHLPHLQALHVEAEALPPLAHLPPSLRRLSLSSFANAARVSLPRGLLLDSLAVHCPGQPVFLGLGRALAQCRRVRATGRSLRLLLQVPPAALPAAASAPAAAAAARALLSAFAWHERVQRLLLEARPGQAQLKLVAASLREQQAGAAAGPAAVAGAAAGPAAPAAPAPLPLDARAVSLVADHAEGVAVTLADGCAALGGAGGGEHFTNLLLEKAAARQGCPERHASRLCRHLRPPAADMASPGASSASDGGAGGTACSECKEEAHVAAAAAAAAAPLCCRVPGCTEELTLGYNKKYRVCVVHAQQQSLDLDHVTVRFCQQCGRFQKLEDFDQGRRSCRASLERHKLRRRQQTRQERLDAAEERVVWRGPAKGGHQQQAAKHAQKRALPQGGSAGEAAKAAAAAQQSKRQRARPQAEAQDSTTTPAAVPPSPASPARTDSPSPNSLLLSSLDKRSSSLPRFHGGQLPAGEARQAPVTSQQAEAAPAAQPAPAPASVPPSATSAHGCAAAPAQQPGLPAAAFRQPQAQLCTVAQPPPCSPAQQAAQPDPALLAELLAGDCLAAPPPLARMQLVHEALRVLQVAEDLSQEAVPSAEELLAISRDLGWSWGSPLRPLAPLGTPPPTALLQQPLQAQHCAMPQQLRPAAAAQLPHGFSWHAAPLHSQPAVLPPPSLRPATAGSWGAQPLPVTTGARLPDAPALAAPPALPAGSAPIAAADLVVPVQAAHVGELPQGLLWGRGW
ncbi:hypothetical protein ABPG75_008932 [Micractinium tetrahymenae]